LSTCSREKTLSVNGKGEKGERLLLKGKEKNAFFEKERESILERGGPTEGKDGTLWGLGGKHTLSQEGENHVWGPCANEKEADWFAQAEGKGDIIQKIPTRR